MSHFIKLEILRNLIDTEERLHKNLKDGKVNRIGNLPVSELIVASLSHTVLSDLHAYLYCHASDALLLPEFQHRLQQQSVDCDERPLS